MDIVGIIFKKINKKIKTHFKSPSVASECSETTVIFRATSLYVAEIENIIPGK